MRTMRRPEGVVLPRSAGGPGGLLTPCHVACRRRPLRSSSNYGSGFPLCLPPSPSYLPGDARMSRASRPLSPGRQGLGVGGNVLLQGVLESRCLLSLPILTAQGLVAGAVKSSCAFCLKRGSAERETRSRTMLVGVLCCVVRRPTPRPTAVVQHGPVQSR